MSKRNRDLVLVEPSSTIYEGTKNNSIRENNQAAQVKKTFTTSIKPIEKKSRIF
jgi:hypothetical protein